MPVTSTGESHSSTSVNMQMQTEPRELDEEEKYWRNKIMNAAMEAILFSPHPNPDPRLNTEVMKKLREAYLKDEDETDADIPHDVRNALEIQIAEKIEQIGQYLIKSTVENLQSAEADEKKEWLSRITESVSPIHEVRNYMEHLKQNEIQADAAIVEAKANRNDAANLFDEDLAEITKKMESVTEMMVASNQPEALRANLDHLNAKSSNLASAVESVKKERTILENSPEVEEATLDIVEKLSAAKEQIQEENEELTAFFDEYDNLDPELKELVNKLKATEDAIERQQWFLDKIRGHDNDNLSDDL